MSFDIKMAAALRLHDQQAAGLPDVAIFFLHFAGSFNVVDVGFTFGDRIQFDNGWFLLEFIKSRKYLVCIKKTAGETAGVQSALAGFSMPDASAGMTCGSQPFAIA